MIVKQDVIAAIAECRGERNPDANTCIKLAAYYTILDHLNEQESGAAFSHDAPKQAETVTYHGLSEFSALVNGRSASEIMPYIDELVDVIRNINPRLYDGFIRKLKSG